MQITITLAQIKNASELIDVPFWFSNDRSIHLASPFNRSIKINLEHYSIYTLDDIMVGINNGLIVVDKKDEFIEYYKKQLQKSNNIETAKEPVQEEKQTQEEIKTAKEKEKLAKQEEKEILQSAKALIDLSVAEIKSKLAGETINDLEVVDSVPLNVVLKALELEQAKAKPRQSVVVLLQEYIEQLSKEIIEISDEKLLTEVEDTDIHLLVKDSNDTIKEIPLQ